MLLFNSVELFQVEKRDGTKKENKKLKTITFSMGKWLSKIFFFLKKRQNSLRRPQYFGPS